jgi:hypothetical protein
MEYFNFKEDHLYKLKFDPIQKLKLHVSYYIFIS